MRKILSAVLMVLPLLAVSIAHADDPIKGTMEAFVVELDEDKEKLSAATDVEPNQLVEYQLTYTNKGESNINGLTVVGPCLLYTSPSPRD